MRVPEDHPCFRTSFPATLLAAREAARSAAAFLAVRGVGEAECFACELALVEAANNAVQHATREQLRHLITLSATLKARRIDLSVEDHTGGFDFPSNLAPPSPTIERGRGLFLIQSLMDDVRYVRGSSTNTLYLWKRRQSTRPH